MSNLTYQNIVPVVETERLILRGHRPEDFEHLYAMWADPVTTQYTSKKPLTEEQAWIKFIRIPGLWAFLGYGYWAVEEKSSGRYIGHVGFAEFRRDIKPSIKGLPENGWVLAKRAHGKGYATETVMASVAWSDKNIPVDQTVCIITPENAASIRLAEKCGYVESPPGVYLGDKTLIFKRDRILPGI